MGTDRLAHAVIATRPLGRVAALLLLLTAPMATEGARDAACVRWRAAFAGMPVKTARVETGGRALTLRVKLADTPERRAAGFQCATPGEIQETLILFDLDAEVLTQFHMQNVPAPLDIAFARGDGRIFAILRMDLSPTALYGPPGPFRYAIEARAGFLESQGIRAGAARLVTGKGGKP